jgi:hypothetical protein
MRAAKTAARMDERRLTPPVIFGSKTSTLFFADAAASGIVPI